MPSKTIMDQLKISPLHVFDQPTLHEWLNTGKLHIAKYDKDQVIHLEGDICDKMEILLSGKVAIKHITADGNVMNVADFNKGDLLGGNLLFTKQPYYPMMILALSKVEVLTIKKDQLFEMLTNFPLFLKAYLEVTSENTFILSSKIKHHVNLTLRDRLLIYLKSESKHQSKKTITLPESKKALAEKLGVERTSLSRELKKMKDDGLIEFDSKTITLLF
jgi:CRP-like cAMP-binding protein